MRIETITEWQERTGKTPKVIDPIVPKPKRKYKPRAIKSLEEGVLIDRTSENKNRSFAEIRKSIRRAYTTRAS